jgi:ABC-type cobalamin/Fe3+-siderophores transport system ATPase subunit
MSIKDYSKYFDKPTNKSKHAPFFPKNIFCIIAGSTGCGKTNLLLNLLLEEGYLDYGSLYVYCSTLYQPAYTHLKKRCEEMETNFKKTYNKNIKIGHFFEDSGDNKKESTIVDPKDLNPKISHVIVFDDVMLSDQTKIKEYFCKGRHNNVNIFYLCQSLHKVGKHCIRDNANIFILFHQDDKALKYFHETYVSGDMDFKN